MRGKHLSVTVAPVLQRAFTRYFPGYELPINDFRGEIEAWQLKEGLYFTCSGGFDGNGLPDAAVYLIEKRAHRVRRSRVPRRRWVFVAFHQIAPGSFQPHLIDRSWDPEFFSNEYLEGAPERITGFPMERKPRGSVFCYVVRDDHYGKMRLKHDAILQYSDDGEAEDVFYFKRGNYHDVNTIDCD